MKNKTKQILTYAPLIIIGTYFLFLGLVRAETFLVPLVIAILVAMIIVPFCNWLEKIGLGRGISSFLSTLLVLIFFVLVAGVLAIQINSFAQNWPEIQKRIEPKIDKAQEFIAEKTSISVSEQQEKISQKLPFTLSGSGTGKDSTNVKQQQSGDSKSGTNLNKSMITSAAGFIAGVVGLLGHFLLTLIYIFFFLLFRDRFKEAITNFTSGTEQKQEADKIINKSVKTSQDYLLGRLMLVIILAVLFSIGLSISGVKNAILISTLAAVLTLVPYLGNIIGLLLAVTMAFFSGSGVTGVVGVLITFMVAQFFESYILEPFLIGKKLNLNPVIIIISVILGGAIWGVAGMLIAIPITSIIKILCDNVPVLQPVGFILGEEKNSEGDEDDNFINKAKKWIKDKF